MVWKCISVVHLVIVTLVPYNIDKVMFKHTREYLDKRKTEAQIISFDEAIDLSNKIFNDKDYKCKRLH